VDKAVWYFLAPVLYWLVVNAGYLLISLPLVHSLYIKGPALKDGILMISSPVLIIAFVVVLGIKTGQHAFFLITKHI